MSGGAVQGSVVVSADRLFGELLTDYLTRNTDETWLNIDRLDRVPAPDAATMSRVILWDVGHLETKGILGEFDLPCGIDDARDMVALLRFKPGEGEEADCISHGIRGFFYERDPVENLLQGVLALLAGQVWISRDATRSAGSFVHEMTPTGIPAPWTLVLSRRERQVLGLVARGRSNKEIGEALHISPHTVKTHLYKIYKKINVSNRMEASIWLMSIQGAPIV